MSSKAVPAGGSTNIDTGGLAGGVADGLSKIESLVYRRTCARFTTGITVVTTLDSHGHPHGMTVNSFSSVSLDPPLVLVSIDLKNAILGHFISSSWFAINILAEHQEDLSRRFSRTSENRFIDVNWHAGPSGTPLLDGVLAQLECSVVRTFDVGDHTVLIGEVRRAGYTDGKPLVYFDSAYRSLR
jgi:flavin reductase (DIM6/NTAB) family NADH-FMN oxidoreductase RutF